MQQYDVKSMTLEELRNLMADWGEKPYRAVQLYEWMHQKRVWQYDQMTNLPEKLRRRLVEQYPLKPLAVIEVQTSRIDGTRKYLFRLADGNLIESVLMKYHHGYSVCISTQVGCRMGCRFCASAVNGFLRNLLPSEMLEQVYRIQENCGARISHVVLMGTGEPLDNYDSVVRFLRMISDEKGLCIGQRNLTVSTCGIVPGILKLAKENLQSTLALSLHAATDRKRRQLMPVARQYSLEEVLSACRTYGEKTGRRVTFAYSLIAGENDSLEDARILAKRLGTLHGLVNLIPVNPVRERPYRQSERGTVDAFRMELENRGLHVTVRREMGSDIDGACGQLRRRYLETQSF